MRTTNLKHFSTKAIARMFEDNELRVDNAVQRAYVWTIPQRSDFIDSILGGWLIPAIHVEKRNAGKTKSRDIYDVLDGQQRCLTIATFYNNEWALENVLPIEVDGTVYDIDGLTFSELPEKLQEVFCDYMLPVFWVDEMTQEEKTIAFRKLNSGKPLSTNDMNVAYCGDLETANGFAEHEVFKKLLTATGWKNKRYISYIMKIYAMLHEDVTDISFESKVFREYEKNIKFNDNDKTEMIGILDYINNLLEYGATFTTKTDKETYKKVKKEVHLISLIPFVKEAMNNGHSVEQFWSFCNEFFNTAGKTYTKASQSDTSKNFNIVNRDTELGNAWLEYKKKFEPKNNERI